LDNNYRIRSVNRALKLLKCFSFEKKQLSLNELSAMLGLNKSTVHRLVKTLEEEDMLKKDTASEVYSLGIAVFQLGNIYRDSLELRSAALPIMQALALSVGETVLINIYSEFQKITIEKVEGPQGLRPTIKVGHVLPAHVGSSGKVILAFMDKEDIDQQFKKRDLQAFTDHTIIDKEILKKELEQIRAAGYSVGFEERTVGGAGVSAPIFGSAGKVIASLSVVGPDVRIKKFGIKKMGAAVVEAAKEISKVMYG